MSLQTAIAAEPQPSEDWVLANPNASDLNDEAKEISEPSEDANADAAAEDEPEELTETQKLAVELGWKPKSQWRGDASGWTDAAEFIRNTHKVLERTQERNRASKREAEDLALRLDRLERTNEAVRRREIADLREEYARRAFEAAKEGDEALFKKLTDEAAELELEARAPIAPEAEVHLMAEETLKNPALRRFYQDHAWILEADDPTAYEYAVSIANQVVAKGGTQVQAIAEAERALRYAYPNQYEPSAGAPAAGPERDPETGQFVAKAAPTQARRAAPPVANGARTPTKGDELQTRISKLPPEALRAMQQEVARGFSQKAWLDIYEGKA